MGPAARIGRVGGRVGTGLGVVVDPAEIEMSLPMPGPGQPSVAAPVGSEPQPQAVERAMLRDDGTRVLHCPSANFKLGSGVAPIPEYLEALRKAII